MPCPGRIRCAQSPDFFVQFSRGVSPSAGAPAAVLYTTSRIINLVQNQETLGTQ